MFEDVLQNNRGTGEVADKWCKKMQKNNCHCGRLIDFWH